MDEFLKLISNVGFPIAAYVMLYFSCISTIKENTKAVNDCIDVMKAVLNSRDGKNNV
jgi:hypothetical protein